MSYTSKLIAIFGRNSCSRVPRAISNSKLPHSPERRSDGRIRLHHWATLNSRISKSYEISRDPWTVPFLRRHQHP